MSPARINTARRATYAVYVAGLLLIGIGVVAPANGLARLLSNWPLIEGLLLGVSRYIPETNVRGAVFWFSDQGPRILALVAGVAMLQLSPVLGRRLSRNMNHD